MPNDRVVPEPDGVQGDQTAAVPDGRDAVRSLARGECVTFSGTFAINPRTYTFDCSKCGSEFHSHHALAIYDTINRFADPEYGPFAR